MGLDLSFAVEFLGDFFDGDFVLQVSVVDLVDRVGSTGLGPRVRNNLLG